VLYLFFFLINVGSLYILVLIAISLFFSLLFYTLYDGIFRFFYTEVHLEQENTWYKLTSEVQKIDKAKYRIFEKKFCCDFYCILF